jgi:hypothetical protein
VVVLGADCVVVGVERAILGGAVIFEALAVSALALVLAAEC